MKEEIEIIAMGREHISAVLEIEKATFSEAWSEKDFSDCLNHENHHYFCAIQEGKVLGYVGYWGVLDEAQIYNVAVDRAYRGQGIGKSLMKHLIDFGKKDGRLNFLLEVRTSNFAAVQLYRSLGFRKDGIRPGFYDKPKEDALLMSLRFQLEGD